MAQKGRINTGVFSKVYKLIAPAYVSMAVMLAFTLPTLHHNRKFCPLIKGLEYFLWE